MHKGFEIIGRNKMYYWVGRGSNKENDSKHGDSRDTNTLFKRNRLYTSKQVRTVTKQVKQ